MTVMTTMFSEILVKGTHGDLAKLLWQENGRVIVISDYGNWSYYWSHRGEATVAQFLSGLDMHYMGQKMLGSRFSEHSDEWVSFWERFWVPLIQPMLVDVAQLTSTPAAGS